MTIASCIETEEELTAREDHHICPERALAYLFHHERAVEEASHRN
jgi:hypothetical protein